MANETPQDVEGRFRESLQDVVVVLERLAPLCATPEEMLALIKLGLESDAQLRLLLGRIKR